MFFQSIVVAGGAARMRPKRHGWLRNKLAKFFIGALYEFSTVRKTSVTDDVIDWPLPNKMFGCATDCSLVFSKLSCFYFVKISKTVPTDVALSVISKVGCILSMTGLAITIIAHILNR